MKKSYKIISLVALLLATVICFSGCGLVDFVGSLFGGNNDVTNPTNAPVSETYPINTVVTENIVVTQPVTSAQVPATQKQNTPATTNPPATTAKADEEPSTEEPTTAPAGREKGELSVQEIEARLFDTTDPNIAGQILTTAGFAYDAEQDIYYTPLYPWQRYFGFNVVYDIAAPRTGMIYDTQRIKFDYGDKSWMLQIWKGQYGITAGGEIGFYNRPIERGFHYDCVTDEEMLTMKMDFYNMDELVFTRGPEKHWWLTGFKIFNVGVPMLIDLDITIDFEDHEMANAFLIALRDVCKNSSALDPMTYTRNGDSFNIVW